MGFGLNLSSFINGMGSGLALRDRFQAASDAEEIRAITKARPEQSTGFTADQGDELRRAAESGQYDIGWDDTSQSYVVTPKVDPSMTAKVTQQGVTDFLGKRTAGNLSEDDAFNARQLAIAGVLDRRDPGAASRIRRDLVTSKREDQRFEWEQQRAERDAKAAARKEADDAELRDAMGHNPVVISRMGPDGRIQQADSRITRRANGQEGAGGQQDDAANYFQTAAPRVISVLVKQGKLHEAQKYQEFIDSQQGRQYATMWTQGVRALSFGDTQTAMQQFEQLYNSQLFNDGLTAKFSTIDPKAGTFQIDLQDKDGKVVATQQGSANELASKAAVFLDPVRAVEFQAKETAKRQSEEAVLDRQIRLESIRQRGREQAEDRRDARLAARLGVTGKEKPLSTSQQRINQEIDVSRRTIAEIDPAELKRKTTPTNQWGGRNPDFDPALARAASQANRRKYGEDPDFDGRGKAGAGDALNQQGGSKVAPSAADRFKADKSMQSNRLGKQTDRGYEVFDSKGKLIGYYR